MLSPFSYSPPRYLEETTGYGYSIGAKINVNQNSDGPGPGAYESNDRLFQKKGGGYMGRKINAKKK